MSFWTPDAATGFVSELDAANYSELLHPFSLDNAYWKDMLRSFQISAIAVVACLVFGFPVAYFLAMKVKKLEYQIALFILALAPFWTSFITRSVAWAYPLMGSQGALNQFLVKLGISSYDHPLLDTQFTQLSVQLAMIQLYILFMVTPIFFLLAQVDRHAIEAARDLGGNWWSTFREVILPQTMPGIVIGSIFIFVLTMGEYGTVEVISQGAVTTVGVYVQTQIIGTQYPQGAASAVLLVLILILGVFVITRFSNLREDSDDRRLRPRHGADAGQRRQAAAKRRRDWAKWGLATYFVIFLIFLYAPMILMAILSFQGYYGRRHLPVQGPAGLDWWRSIFDEPGRARSSSRTPGGIRAAGEGSLWVSLAAGAIVAFMAFTLSMAFRRRFRGRRHRLLHDPARADDARLPARPRHADLLEVDGRGDVALADGARHEHGLGHPVRVPRHDRDLEPLRRPHRRGGARPRRQRGEDVQRGDPAARLDRHLRRFLFGFTLTWNDFDRTVLLVLDNTLPLQIVGLIQAAAIRPDLYALGTATTLVSLR